MEFEPVIGLEIHAQLLTRSKAFCGCSTAFGAPPNTNTCPVCLGHPGALPVLNKQMVEMTIAMGLATHCSIRSFSLFARKNYFYHDLPKGYQISQYEEPLCYDGWVEIELEDGSTKKIGLIRIHMEEDTGKSIHDVDIDTLLDFNRAGVPLIEIVSKPDLRSAREAYLFLKQIHQIVTYLGICSGNMEEGALRCDANVSVRPKGSSSFGTKTEVKNLNSFRHVEKALEYEIQRQIQVLQSGGIVRQETMLWDPVRQETRPMRTKEQAHDYRYFPEPDLVPVVVPEEWIERIRQSLPELGLERKRRFIQQYHLPAYDAGVLTQQRAVADYFEEAVEALQQPSPDRIKGVSNLIMTEVLRVLAEKNIEIQDFPVPPASLAALAELLAEGTISSRIGKTVFEKLLQHPDKHPEQIVEEEGLVQISDESALRQIVEEVLEQHPGELQRYFGGKKKLFGFFVGQVMKATKGKANPKVVNQLLQQILQEREAAAQQ